MSLSHTRPWFNYYSIVDLRTQNQNMCDSDVTPTVYLPAAPTEFPGYQYPPSPIEPNIQPTVAANVVTPFGPYPMQIKCPLCHSSIFTTTRASTGALTWIISATLVFLGCFLGCCLIPCFVRSCKDIEHFCPNCKSYLGIYKRLG